MRATSGIARAAALVARGHHRRPSRRASSGSSSSPTRSVPHAWATPTTRPTRCRTSSSTSSPAARSPASRCRCSPVRSARVTGKPRPLRVGAHDLDLAAAPAGHGVGLFAARPIMNVLVGNGHPGCSAAAEQSVGARMLVVFMPQVLLYGGGDRADRSAAGAPTLLRAGARAPGVERRGHRRLRAVRGVRRQSRNLFVDTDARATS